MSAGSPFTVAEGRKFGLTVGAAFVALAGLVLWRGHPLVAGIALAPGVGLLLAGLLVPAHLGPVHRVWMRGAHLISRVTTPLFMGAVYLLVVTPTGLLMRILGHNPIRRVPEDGSYWLEKERKRSDLERQF